MLFLLLALLLSGGVSAAVAMAVLRGRGSRPEDIASESVHQRLRRIEDTLEAMAGEIERQGEGQRFLTALLADPAHASRARLEAGGERKDAADTPADGGIPRGRGS